MLPDPTPAVRTDGLWHRTCFEAFLQPPGGDAYHELNLAPCGAWAAYRFDSYRVGMADADVPAPRITASATADGFELRATVDLSGVTALAGPWRVALTAVIEGAGGEAAAAEMVARIHTAAPLSTTIGHAADYRQLLLKRQQNKQRKKS